MNKVLLSLVIIGAVFATTAQDQVIATIKRIDATQFGKTLLDTIQIQLQTTDPLDTLLQTLNDLEDGLTADQKDDDATNQSFQASCDYDLAGLDKDLAESTLKQTLLEAKLEGQLYPTRQILQSIVNAKTKEVRGYQADINELDATRSEEKEEFEQKVDEHNAATAVISEVKRIFSDNLQANGEAVFLQGKVSSKAFVSAETSALVQKHLLTSARAASKNIHRKSYAKIFKVLATIASKAHQLADQGSVSNIITLLDQLLSRISDSLDLERGAEDKRINSYNKSRRLLTATLNINQTALANVQTELAGTEDNITVAETSLENTVQRIANKSEERADRYEECEQAAQTYADTRNNRSSDRQTISDALGIINAQLRTLREQLALRLSAGDNLD